MAVVKESEPFDWIQWLPGMWEVLPFCNPLSLLISQPNVHIQQFCLAGNLNISGSQRLLSWQQRLEGGVVSAGFVLTMLTQETAWRIPIHTSNPMYDVNGTACRLRMNMYGMLRGRGTSCLVALAPGGGLELAFPATATAVGTHRL